MQNNENVTHVCFYLSKFHQTGEEDKLYIHSLKGLQYICFLLLGKISHKELFYGLEGENYNKFYTYLENLKTVNPERRVRYSDTVFVKPRTAKELFEDLRYRLEDIM
jgi:hypothetical protein